MYAYDTNEPTRRARALDVLHQLGQAALAPGLLANIQVWDRPTCEDVLCRIGNNAIETVVKRGVCYRFRTAQDADGVK